MSSTQKNPDFWKQATRELSAADPIMAGIIAAHPEGMLASRGEPFYTLARSIVGQQISVKAADSVWARFETQVKSVTPKKVLAASDEALRSCGLSGQKVKYMRHLSEFFDAHPNPDWNHRTDEEVMKELIAIKGIGRWTIEMFLIFNLMRPDVFPIADIGVQKGIIKHYTKGKPMSLAQMEKLAAKKWKPWRSVATWYLWRSLDPVPVEY